MIDRVNERSDSQSGGRTPIIAMTANAMQGDREKALEAGMGDYVPKPVKSQELDAVLGSWISQGKGRDTQPQASAPDGESDFANPLPSIDSSVIEGLRDLQQEGEPDILTEFVELLLDDTPVRLKALRAAVEEGDERSVERTAHALKGSCENMGVARMAALCNKLQEIGCSGSLAWAPQLLDRLEAESHRAGHELGENVAKR